MRAAVLVLLAACGNDLPGLGTCEVAPGDGTPELVAVPLVGQPASFDDLRYAPQLGKVIAAPQGTGRIFLVDPDTLAVEQAAAPGGSSSADANATTVFVGDRGGGRIIAIDAATKQQTLSQDVDGTPDYVRAAPTVPEVWVTLPGRNRIEILDSAGLVPIGTVDIPGAPEGLTFDAQGRAYTQSGGNAIVIDVERRVVLAELDTGCGSSHGFPQVDRAYDLVIGGCDANGGAGVATGGGDLVSGLEAGGGSAILAYDDTRHHLYLRGDPGATLDVVAVCSGGGMSVLAKVSISDRGHGASADDRGHVWVCDATTGGLQRITDPFAATN